MLSADMQAVLDRDRLAQQLSRCAFLLFKFYYDGDHIGLENAKAAVEDAVATLKEVGQLGKWFKQFLQPTET